jgi:hypothetical protein
MIDVKDEEPWGPSVVLHAPRLNPEDASSVSVVQVRRKALQALCLWEEGKWLFFSVFLLQGPVLCAVEVQVEEAMLGQAAHPAWRA